MPHCFAVLAMLKKVGAMIPERDACSGRRSLSWFDLPGLLLAEEKRLQRGAAWPPALR